MIDENTDSLFIGVYAKRGRVALALSNVYVFKINNVECDFDIQTILENIRKLEKVRNNYYLSIMKHTTENAIPLGTVNHDMAEKLCETIWTNNRRNASKK